MTLVSAHFGAKRVSMIFGYFDATEPINCGSFFGFSFSFYDILGFSKICYKQVNFDIGVHLFCYNVRKAVSDLVSVCIYCVLFFFFFFLCIVVEQGNYYRRMVSICKLCSVRKSSKNSYKKMRHYYPSTRVKTSNSITILYNNNIFITFAMKKKQTKKINYCQVEK